MGKGTAKFTAISPGADLLLDILLFGAPGRRDGDENLEVKELGPKSDMRKHLVQMLYKQPPGT